MKTRIEMRKKRKARIRAVITGTAARPRLAVFRSGRAMIAQLIDDGAGKTIIAKRTEGKNIAAATALGKEIAAMAGKHKISAVVFDRGGFRYHGAVKALADAVREGGIPI
ncbi:50S ribosomal protein L18 [Candidatus Gottesmanbacteria bacterium RIFCSPHIGHO2_01_FULL_46_14]|uniref:Large ribosomal subunit protein uL18 n=3 Tax=Candidatus Gottesmaniibacteriota TaxID=1752720 RepID=A0A1F5ZRY4_9BACT|nr:MAG: 50S ribosomal protein L18 [Candidatus Gottesmanbacteria bacterium RIFCSPHIGHO2_01_FULL_46_14]OGG28653.1 MAG: 50S ribosomal protein L18 [Candidatus Gottesmanbacteria bacterium RIFCSPLOWO2_01_FULL_46_21]